MSYEQLKNKVRKIKILQRMFKNEVIKNNLYLYQENELKDSIWSVYQNDYKNNQKFQLPEHVMLLDDVVTTGSTCNEICRLLKANGVKKVTVISICLSLPENTVNIQ